MAPQGLNVNVHIARATAQFQNLVFQFARPAMRFAQGQILAYFQMQFDEKPPVLL